MRGGEPPLPPERLYDPGEVPRELVIEPWVDEVVESTGFGPRSMYVEACWLPVLGPTATWLYRRLGSWVQLNSGPTSVDLADLSLSLGLGQQLGRHGPLMRAFGRLTRFQVARWQGDSLGVRRALAPLPESRAVHLSPTAYRLHQQLTDQYPEWHGPADDAGSGS